MAKVFAAGAVAFAIVVAMHSEMPVWVLAISWLSMTVCLLQIGARK